MNPLIVFTLLVAAVSAAPAPGVLHAAVPAAVTFAHPVQVPLTKTVHYDVKNVVTGYSTSIIKPSIGLAAAAPFITTQNLVAAQPAVVAAPAAPVVVAGSYLQHPFQSFPTIPNPPSPPSPPSDSPNPPPASGGGGSGGYPQFPAQFPSFPNFPTPTTPPPTDGDSSSSSSTTQNPQNPIGQFPGGQDPSNPVGQLPGGQDQNVQNPIPGAPGGPPAPMPDPNNPPSIPGEPTPAFPNLPQLPQYPGQPGGGESATQNPGTAPSPNDPSTDNNPYPNYPNFPTFPAFPPPSTQFHILNLNPIEQPAAVAVAQPVPAPAPAPVQVEAAPVEIQSDDTEVVSNPEFRSVAAPVQPATATLVQAAPAFGYQHFGYQQVVAAPAPLTYAAPALTYPTYVAALPALQRVQLHQDTPSNVVTQEQVLAPVRTHTQVTPQITQIQPEVTVRKVIHDVPVATPVIAQPALTLAAAPVHGFNFAF